MSEPPVPPPAAPDEPRPLPPTPDGPRPQSARDLVRKRRGVYRAPETGRHHHIGAAPELQPVLGEDGSQYVETAAVQLAERTVAQLRQQHERLQRRMAQAAQELDFERAAQLRDALAAVDGELDRRSHAT